MRLIQIDAYNKIKIDKKLVACIGYFDGIHKGHQALIDETKSLSQKYKCEPALITFDPDPWVTIKGLKDIKHITTIKQRINLAVKHGIKNVIILKFDYKMANMSFEDFENNILAKCNIHTLICGFDFRYGKNGEGNSLTLKASGHFNVEIIDSINEGNEKISTTRIVECIKNGDIKLANKMLGYEYEIQGKVIEGRQKGRLIGFKTANIKVEEEYYLPKKGVYAGLIRVENKWYKAMINIGNNPTFNYTEKLSVEVNIINFNKEIYGLNISLKFTKFLRDEIKFSNIDNLKLQLEQDLFNSKKALKNYEL